MPTKERIRSLLEQLSDSRAREVLDFMHFLTWQDECVDWERFGKAQFAKAYGDDEPEYGLSDVREGIPS